jgi:carbon-monoxide dehydrogenase medium subunit
MLGDYGEDAKVISGGTALNIMLKSSLVAVSTLVSIDRVRELRYISEDARGGVRIGALSTLSQVATDPVVLKRHPAVAQSCSVVGNIRVRNVATFGGNLAEADYASDPPPVLVASRAQVTLASIKGTRDVDAADFFVDFYETALSADEVLTHVTFPVSPPEMSSVYLKYRSRSSEDRPCVGVAAVVEMDSDDICHELRVVVGGIAGTPQEFHNVEALANGQRVTSAMIKEIARGYAELVDPIEDVRGSAWYRKRMVDVFVHRAVEAVLEESRRSRVHRN